MIRGSPNGVTHTVGDCIPVSEYIGYGSETQGTEPSKYLEEKKTIVIPLVAASEGGRAQTRIMLKACTVVVWGL